MTKPRAQTFSSRLSQLFDMVPKDTESGEKWTSAALAAEVTRTGVPTGQSHMAHLRSGTRSNPSAALVKAIADVFGVPVGYFYDESDSHWEADLEAVALLRSAGVRGVALRASSLSPRGLARLAELADLIRDVEGLPPAHVVGED